MLDLGGNPKDMFSHDMAIYLSFSKLIMGMGVYIFLGLIIIAGVFKMKQIETFLAGRKDHVLCCRASVGKEMRKCSQTFDE